MEPPTSPAEHGRTTVVALGARTQNKSHCMYSLSFYKVTMKSGNTGCNTIGLLIQCHEKSLCPQSALPVLYDDMDFRWGN